MRELTFSEDLCNDILAGGQGFFLSAAGLDETYCQEDIRRAVADIGKYTTDAHPPLACVCWDLIKGFWELRGPEDDAKKSYLKRGWREAYNDKMTDPIKALSTVIERGDNDKNIWGDENVIFIFRDLQQFFNIPAVERLVRNGCNQRILNGNAKKGRRPLVVLAPNSSKLVDSMKATLRVMNYPLPTEEELTKVLSGIENSPSVKSKFGVIESDDLRERISRGMLGLPRSAAENILAFAIRIVAQEAREKSTKFGWSLDVVRVIEDRKSQELQKSEILRYTPRHRLADMNDVGGCDLFKDWLSIWKKCFTRRARELNLMPPKGVILIGPPGTGKSLIASVVAADLGLPLFELNYARAYGSLVGETEERLERGLDTIDSVKECVVMIDEAEKLLAGAKAGSTTSNDVSTRAFGIFNRWLTMRKGLAFVICTCNRTEGIPDEFLRKGRFNEIFLVGRPADPERCDIAKIHLRKQTAKVSFSEKEWKKFAEATNGFVGAEIEEVVTMARYRAFEKRDSGDPTIDELIAVAESITPQAKSKQAASIEDMIAAASDAKPVSSYLNQDRKESRQQMRAVEL